MPVCREGAMMRFFFFRVCNYCIQSCSNDNSPSHTILNRVHLLPFPLLGTLQWRCLFFQTHWQNICSVSALLLGLFYYIHLEINHHNSSSQNKQIFAIALRSYKLRCSLNTSRWSLSCCPHSQKIRKSIKMLYFRCPGHHNSTTLHVPKACLLLRLLSSNKERQKSKAELPHRYLSGLPSTASSFPFADNERTFLQLSLCPITLHLSVDYLGKFQQINPYRKPNFIPQTLSFTLRCKELKQWFISTIIEKCLLGKESSGAKEPLQPHSLALPIICLQGPSVTASSDGFVQLGLLILRDSHINSNVQATQGRQISQTGITKAGCVLWEAMSNHAIWNTMLCGAELCVCRKAPYSWYLHFPWLGMTLPWPCLSSRDTCTSSWVLFSNPCWKSNCANSA